MRVLIANDHPILRRGLEEILLRELEAVECGEAKDAEEGELLRQCRADVAPSRQHLLNRLNQFFGRAFLVQVAGRSSLQHTRTVVIRGNHAQDQYGKPALLPLQIFEDVKTATARHGDVDKHEVPVTVSDLGGDTEQPLHERLSDRELEVLRMLASGKTISQLARELHLSVATVSTYRARLLQKMGMTTNAELMRYALRNRLID